VRAYGRAAEAEGGMHPDEKRHYEGLRAAIDGLEAEGRSRRAPSQPLPADLDAQSAFADQ
jgi:hypothetical protein